MARKRGRWLRSGRVAVRSPSIRRLRRRSPRSALPTRRPLDERFRASVVIGGGNSCSWSPSDAVYPWVVTSAVVAMADDGGSTCILRREEADVTPPDDIRAPRGLAKDPADPARARAQVPLAVAHDHALAISSFGCAGRCDGVAFRPSPSARSCWTPRGTCIPPRSTGGAHGPDPRARSLDGSGRRLPFQDGACARSACARGRFGGALPAGSGHPRGKSPHRAGPGVMFRPSSLNLLIPGVVEAIRASRVPCCSCVLACRRRGDLGGSRPATLSRFSAAHGMEGLLDHMLSALKVPLPAESPATGSLHGHLWGRLRHASRSDLDDPSSSRTHPPDLPSPTRTYGPSSPAAPSIAATSWTPSSPRYRPSRPALPCAMRLRGC